MHVQAPVGYQPITAGDYVVMEMECRAQSILQASVHVHEVQGTPSTGRLTGKWQIGSMAIVGPYSIGAHTNSTPIVWQDVFASDPVVGNLVVDADWPHRIALHSTASPFVGPRTVVRHLRTPVLHFIRLLLRAEFTGGTTPSFLTTVSLHQLFATS